MQNVYEDVSALDKRVCERFALTPQILVENAANALLELIKQKAHKKSVVTIICGSGDNGADGYALARKLSGSYRVRIYQAKEPKSPLCVEMCDKARLLEEIRFITKLLPCDVVVDCLFGSGFRGSMSEELLQVLKTANALAPLKIACDIPSGLNAESSGLDTQSQSPYIFSAHHTMCMGALKTALLSDVAKDYVGEIHIAELGVARQNYEIASPIKLLESSDLVLPTRTRQNAHKGDFGHLCVYAGSKSGAAILAAQSALHFGAGLVSVVGEKLALPYEIMTSKIAPHNTTAFALGMGLGEIAPKILGDMIQRNEPCVIDADALYHTELKELLEYRSLLENTQRQIVLTPHPKEFVALLRICGFGDVNLTPANRLEYAMRFTQRYPETTLLLKGANTLIAHKEKIYINTLGSVALAKGGSGDVLAGMIGALLAQGHSGIESAIHASLAHALASQLESSTYALTPQKLIQNLALLERKHYGQYTQYK